MSRYRGVTWDPSPNFTRGPTRKTRVVLHRMGGAYAGGLSWLKNPASRVSANFTVDNVSGQGRQLVDTADEAWAQADYNPDSISIEIGGQPTDPVSAAAWATVANIIDQAVELDGVARIVASPAGEFAGIAYHGQLGELGGNHPDCPGQIVIDQIPVLVAGPTQEDQVDATMTPTGQGTWRVHPNGTVFTAGDAQYYGGYPDLPEPEREGERTFVAIERLGATVEAGYVLLADDGAAYRFTPAVWANLKK